MTARFKCRSEYQKSFRVPRSTSVCPQRGAPPAGLRCDQMGICREPGLQRRKRLGPPGPAESCSVLLCPPDPRNSSAPPAATQSPSAHGKKTALEPNPPTPPGPRADPGLGTQGAGPAADPGSVEPGAAGKSAKPRPSKLDSRPQPSQPLTSAPDGRANEVQRALRWRVGLKGQRSGIQRTEYHRQFSWKKPATAASPILAAEQLLYSGSRCVPPFKKHPIPLETEYRRSFRGQVPSPGPRLREHLEHHQRAPLFHVHTTNKKKREESVKKTRPRQDNVTPTQVQRGPRIPEGGGATEGDAQVRELRLKASSYRRRAWGANFDRDHLSQLLSEHNALWEPTDTTDGPTPRPTFDLHADPDSCGTSPAEALSPARSSRRSSVTSSTDRNTPTPPGQAARGGGGEYERSEEGRLPTPRLKMRPVQRTHHDLTTPATGGAILVGKLSSDEASPNKPRRESSADQPVKLKEAWSDNSPAFAHTGPSLDHKPATSPASKPIRTKQTSPMAPRPLAPPPPHCIRGTLRNADFQHNGELGLRFRELRCPGRGSCSHEDDRLSVMSWRSAASCSAASVVLERAQKRREHFWGKR
uniref:Nuclear protein MDM1 n=1 Tax=Gasterosteus aculeatus aculeatus TaxID=481459 RepID=A0AAQ4NXA1_GASAC|nr:nuclear protein MDM1 isoform X1 [Gasterosteus aculeatus aculeatus]